MNDVAASVNEFLCSRFVRERDSRALSTGRITVEK